MRICIGFDGSDKDDYTCIRAETLGGWQFTPTYGPDKRPTIWDPAEWGGRIPRSEVHAAMHEIFDEHDVERAYLDPPLWKTEIEEWALEFGDERFIVDLGSGALTHDGCPVTEAHIANARMFARTNQRYILLKPSQTQKIDAAVTSVITHEAAADARAAGWTDQYVPGKGISTAAYGFS